jgi:hypothetical protein
VEELTARIGDSKVTAWVPSEEYLRGLFAEMVAKPSGGDVDPAALREHFDRIVMTPTDTGKWSVEAFWNFVSPGLSGRRSSGGKI